MDESLRPRQTDDAPRLEELKDAFMGAVERTFPIKQETVTETRPLFSKEELKAREIEDKKFNNYLNRSDVLNYLKQKGLSRNAIIGIAANIDVETGGSFDYQQKQLNDGPGYGLFQLDRTGPLPKAYEEYRKEKNIEDSLQSQIDFMYETIYGDRKYRDILGYGHGSKLQKVFEEGTPEEVTLEFMKRWERPGKPHTDRRLKAAAELAASRAIGVMYD